MSAYRRIKITDNAIGKYYVDYSCIACETCASIAPNNFRIKNDRSSAMLFNQPQSEYEEHACNTAKNSCPAEAIGDDGEL